MLSAQKEHIRLAASASPDDLPKVGSFGKVVNSIQGLQQRLENFSADDVGEAHDRIRTLLLRLSDLERMLTRFAAIKESMAEVRRSLDQVLRDCDDSAKVEELEKPLRIQTLIQANKLIQFPRLNKLANVSGDQPAGNPDERITTHSIVEDNDLRSPRTNEEPKQPVETQSPQATDIATSEPQTAAPDRTISATFVAQENSPADPLTSPIADLSPATGLDFVLTPDSQAPESEEQQVNSYDPPASEPAQAIAVTSPIVTVSAAAPNDEETKEAFAVTHSTEFDQRLLDDLIKNYGEFAASLSSSRTVEIPDSPDADSAEIHTDDTVHTIELEPERNNLPSIKREGDLDRQLKKLIKDYGEYDLYSRQSPVNLKTGVVAAFLLLALILSGFYYFSPKAVTSQSVNTAPAHIHSPSTVEAKDSENLANQPAAPVAEAGAPHTTESNSRLKSRK
jgi:hypothetical protein